MRKSIWTLVVLGLTAVAIGGCEDDEILIVDGDEPAPPRALQARYYNRAVYLTWELSPGWDEDSFRVYGKRRSDPDFFLIAEVTNCADGLCSYTDINIFAGITYEYYVSAVDPVSGLETPSANSVEVSVPEPIPPPVPGAARAVAMDNAVYIRWDDGARDAGDFSFYRVYLDAETPFLLGETDSEGFLDLLAVNGETYRYFVTSVDDQGHESSGSTLAEGTPRPDFHGEWIYAYEDQPQLSGFRFQENEFDNPIVDGDSPSRHFRLEVDEAGWWMVPGPGTEIHPSGFVTTALKCGPGSDGGCESLDIAPTAGYASVDVDVFVQTTYALRVTGNDGARHYAAVRIDLQGFDQDGNAIMIFDWAYQLQPGNPALVPSGS
jgi:hypothetical protein